ncbi:MAG TPA: peptidylprolyl isomerase, partial [Elusimicrobiota bacterium]|nr:peptidylprolyl isomerase [Elusimicrobiota bacterium]
GFYRAVPGFILQGGDREDGPAPAPRAFSAGPTGRRFDKPGMVGFTDPAARGSFFITLMPAPWLDADHAPFGEVVQGMGLVEKAAASPEEPYDAQGRRIDRLRRPLLIRKISIEQR